MRFSPSRSDGRVRGSLEDFAAPTYLPRVFTSDHPEARDKPTVRVIGMTYAGALPTLRCSSEVTMTTMSRILRRRADHCLRLANATPHGARRLALLELASQWRTEACCREVVRRFSGVAPRRAGYDAPKPEPLSP